jgi:hypothetical protein
MGLSKWPRDDPFKFSGSAPLEMSHALGNSLKKELIFKGLVFNAELCMDQSVLDYYRSVQFEVSFVLSYDQKEVFLRTFAQYSDRP